MARLTSHAPSSRHPAEERRAHLRRDARCGGERSSELVKSASVRACRNLYVGESSRLARSISSEGCIGFPPCKGALASWEPPHFSKRKRSAHHVTVLRRLRVFSVAPPPAAPKTRRKLTK